MPNIPQELIDIILHQVEDVESLKACSLVSSALLPPSQRILLHSLTLTAGWGEKSNFSAVPHVAAYITRLTIRLPSNASDVQNLRQALGKLTTVRRCIVEIDPILPWSDHPPELTSVLLDFFACQHLRELHLHGGDKIPRNTFLQFLLAAPGVFFLYCSVDPKLRDPLVPPPLCLSGLQRLSLGQNTDSIGAFLTRPQLQPLTAALRVLSIRDNYKANARLIFNCTRTLEHICFNGTGFEWDQTVLPHLPALRSVAFVHTFDDHASPWFLETITALLTPDSTPRLAEITIRYSRTYSQPLRYIVNAGLMGILNRGLTLHSAAPRIRWRLDFRDDAARRFADFTEIVRRGMPEMHSRGRVVFEPYEAYVQPEGAGDVFSRLYSRYL
ncbi:hypothetical protein B0H11DRAFT_1959755 [Mycena galericulata]|nr:hypothetical protein B0H11DRAFT_1959755 [Mycena galericulata]